MIFNSSRIWVPILKKFKKISQKQGIEFTINKLKLKASKSKTGTSVKKIDKELHAGTSKDALVTIVARNYLGMGFSFAESARKHHSEVQIYIYVMDDISNESQAEVEALGFRFLSPQMVSIPPAAEMYRRYDVTEACTAVKPFVLRHLFQLGFETVCYMDPDLWVLSPMTELFEALKTSEIVLTPHTVTPIPEGSAFEEKWLLQCGVFNLGFIGIRHEVSERLCAWWADRLETHCYFRPEQGLFFDQKWIDLVPCLFDRVGILKHRGYNVAWWNLHERTPNFDDGSWFVAETREPIRFFHFSSLPGNSAEPRLSGNISGDKMSRTYDVIEKSSLKHLVGNYRQCLKKHGHAQRKLLPYGLESYRARRPNKWLSRAKRILRPIFNFTRRLV